MDSKPKRSGKGFEAKSYEADCEPLEPIGTVIRELTRPDGTTLKVEVPVYPPFRLRDRRKPASSPRSRRG